MIHKIIDLDEHFANGVSSQQLLFSVKTEDESEEMQRRIIQAYKDWHQGEEEFPDPVYDVTIEEVFTITNMGYEVLTHFIYEFIEGDGADKTDHLYRIEK